MTKYLANIGMASIVLLFMAVSNLGSIEPAMADDRFGEDGHGRVYSGVKNGRLKPLSRILKAAQRKVKGRVTNVKLINRGGKQVYRVKILKSNGHLVSVYFNAQTGSRERNGERNSSRKRNRGSVSSRGESHAGERADSGSSSRGHDRSSHGDDGFGDRDEDSGGRGRGRHRGRGDD